MKMISTDGLPFVTRVNKETIRWNVDITKCQRLRDWQNIFVITKFLCIEIRFHRSYWGEEYLSLYRSRQIEARYIEVPLYKIMSINCLFIFSTIAHPLRQIAIVVPMYLARNY